MKSKLILSVILLSMFVNLYAQSESNIQLFGWRSDNSSYGIDYSYSEVDSPKVKINLNEYTVDYSNHVLPSYGFSLMESFIGKAPKDVRSFVRSSYKFSFIGLDKCSYTDTVYYIDISDNVKDIVYRFQVSSNHIIQGVYVKELPTTFSKVLDLFRN